MNAQKRRRESRAVAIVAVVIGLVVLWLTLFTQPAPDYGFPF